MDEYLRQSGDAGKAADLGRLAPHPVGIRSVWLWCVPRDVSVPGRKAT
jgi:hypothetical protein